MREFPHGLATLDMYDQPGQYTVPAGEYPQLVESWERGDAFLSWIGHFGQTMTVKGARVECIAFWSCDAWAEKESEAAELKLQGGE
ncbi:MAG TPA: hypothetical protein VGI97_14795 [Gemmatimonadaceae bacterium]|jgi:hypothetical protein